MEWNGYILSKKVVQETNDFPEKDISSKHIRHRSLLAILVQSNTNSLMYQKLTLRTEKL